MNFLVLLISLCVVCISSYFVYQNPNLTSWAALLTSLGTFIGSIINIRKKQKQPSKKGAISQHVGDNSSAIQAGGDIKINMGTEK
ncbi:hypothetical protein [Providencia sp. PROV209]|uniref:hypothetical protein n=1 Tax=Providencia sp. PROV209 TaxID=2949906 RepID=UPI00234AC0F6|nr:hypothetical protein [Providencia sp. PROV209]